MNRIKGKTVLITGASSGIGEASARSFASYGANLILCARREARLAQMKGELEGEHGVSVQTRALDVRERRAVETFAGELVAKKAVPDVLLNNAGKALGLHLLHDGLVEDWEEMLDTNVKGLLYMTRSILPAMVERNSGHIVNIGSVAGHQVYQKGAVYNASKFAVRALNEGMSLDLLGTGIKVTSIDPGLVETEFSKVRFHGDDERAEAVYHGYTPLTGDDIADIITFVVNTPDHVNILDLIVLPTAQRSAHMVHKETS
ncbi:MAG: SDR family NAD(P)-dependent oxidoreductase [Gemmatimonadetes bacterium]|nr:SDR family NAD(P)-dependent oxidoreductase [Gemmatimonadota bacterium]NNM04080.1 SDR family NAD(P)-dependent oxidoreductase [Gemmatimonadota bacterium]